MYEVCFDNIKETEEAYTTTICDWQANYNNPDISKHDKRNLWCVGEEDHQQQPQESCGGNRRTKTTAKKNNNANQSSWTVKQRQQNKKQKTSTEEQSQQPKLHNEDGITIVTHGNYKENAGKSRYAYKDKPTDPLVKPVKYKPMKKS